MGNIIQLDVVANIAKNKRGKMPKVGCPEMQDKIDSLLQEIEKIKKQCPDSTEGTDTLKIPPDAKNPDFAEGRWKSTTYIYNTSGDKVVLYFDFYKKGKGEITLVEPDNTECKADLSLSINTGKFIIDQLTASTCNPPPESYNAYYFECEPDNNGCAECWAENKKDKSNKFKFSLVKIK